MSGLRLSGWARWLGTILGLLLAILPSASAWAQAPAPRPPIDVLPKDASSGTDDYYYLDLGSGALTLVDQLRRDPVRVRVQRLGQNLFAEIGRPTTQPAATGEVLLGPIHSAPRNTRSALFVETSTGYVAYYDQLGKNNLFGKIVTVIGRPFATLAAADGNFALLMRHNANGRTEGAYLYHAGSGRGLYLRISSKISADAPTSGAAGFPKLTGMVSAAELQVFDRTTGYLVADAADGSLRYLDLAGDNFSTRNAGISLFPALSADVANPETRRLTSVPIRDNRETTTHVLFVDAATGDLAVLQGVSDPSQSSVVRKLGANLYSVLGTSAADGWRNVAAVPGTGANGATSGIWLIDSLTRRAAYVEGADTPGSTTIRRVRVGS